jgi:hypothetical protein
MLSIVIICGTYPPKGSPAPRRENHRGIENPPTLVRRENFNRQENMPNE